jgi:AcrR family transcriptional regulator
LQMKDRTKAMFAEGLEDLLAVKPLSRIRVIDLCKRCGAAPPTFYYHFHDKYDLAAWIYLRDIASSLGDREPEYSPDRIAASLRLMEKRKTFYQKVFADDSQNSVTKYYMTYIIQMVKDVMAAAETEPTEYQMLEAKHHSYGIIGLLKEWINDETDLSAEELAEFYFEHTPQFLKEAFHRYSFRSSEILSNAGRQAP